MPFIKQMGVISGNDSVQEMCSFTMRGKYPQYGHQNTGGVITEDDARDNFFKEQ